MCHSHGQVASMQFRKQMGKKKQSQPPRSNQSHRKKELQSFQMGQVEDKCCLWQCKGEGRRRASARSRKSWCTACVTWHLGFGWLATPPPMLQEKNRIRIQSVKKKQNRKKKNNSRKKKTGWKRVDRHTISISILYYFLFTSNLICFKKLTCN